MTVFKRKDGFDWVLKDGQHLGREREENEAAQLGNCPSKSKNGNESQLCPSDSEQPISESGVGQFPSTLCTHTHTHPHTHTHTHTHTIIERQPLQCQTDSSPTCVTCQLN